MAYTVYWNLEHIRISSHIIIWQAHVLISRAHIGISPAQFWIINMNFNIICVVIVISCHLHTQFGYIIDLIFVIHNIKYEFKDIHKYDIVKGSALKIFFRADFSFLLIWRYEVFMFTKLRTAAILNLNVLVISKLYNNHSDRFVMSKVLKNAASFVISSFFKKADGGHFELRIYTIFPSFLRAA